MSHLSVKTRAEWGHQDRTVSIVVSDLCDEIERLEKKLEKYESSPSRCNKGHVVHLPIALWDCPTCHEQEVRARSSAEDRASLLLGTCEDIHKVLGQAILFAHARQRGERLAVPVDGDPTDMPARISGKELLDLVKPGEGRFLYAILHGPKDDELITEDTPEFNVSTVDSFYTIAGAKEQE